MFYTWDTRGTDKSHRDSSLKTAWFIDKNFLDDPIRSMSSTFVRSRRQRSIIASRKHARLRLLPEKSTPVNCAEVQTESVRRQSQTRRRFCKVPDISRDPGMFFDPGRWADRTEDVLAIVTRLPSDGDEERTRLSLATPLRSADGFEAGCSTSQTSTSSSLSPRWTWRKEVPIRFQDIFNTINI